MSDFNKFCYGCFFETKENPCPNCGYITGSPQHSASCLTPGTLLNGQYVIGKTLGQGGFGITYLAYDQNLDLKVCIKEYMPEGMVTRSVGDPAVSVYSGNRQEYFDFGVSKFLEEARILARFTANPNIVGVRTFFKENGTAYFVMDYVEGMSLKEYTAANGGRLTYKETLRLTLPVMDAMESVHRMSMLHRDISPDNIYITKTGDVKLLDFGAARYTLSEHSKSLSVILKPGFAPEEQYRSRGKQGPWTDVYSLSATIYRTMTGILPPEALDRIHDDDLVPPSVYCGDIPDFAEAAVLKALSIKGQDRFQTMSEFKDALTGRFRVVEVPASPVIVPDREDPVTVAVTTADKTADRTVAVAAAAIAGNPADRTVAVAAAATDGNPADKTVAVAVNRTIFVPQPAKKMETKRDPSIIHIISAGYGKICSRRIYIFTAAAGILVLTGGIILASGLGQNLTKGIVTNLSTKSGLSESLNASGTSHGDLSSDLTVSMSGENSKTNSVPGSALSNGTQSGSTESLPGSGAAGSKSGHGFSNAGSSSFPQSASGSSSASSSGAAPSVPAKTLDSGTPVNTIGTTNPNLTNGGLATQQGNRIYYVNSTQTKICKTDNAGSFHTMVLSVNKPRSLNVLGDWVYFLNGSDNDKPYKVKTDGSGLAKISNENMETMLVTSGWIYFIDKSDQKVKRINLNGLSLADISKNRALYFNYSDGFIFYTNSDDGDRIYKISGDGSGANTALSTNAGRGINVYPGLIYYKDSLGNHYQIKPDGTGQSRITQENSGYMNVTGGYIFYTNMSDNNCMYGIVSRGVAGTKRKFTDHTSYEFSMVGDWVYFYYDINENGNPLIYRLRPFDDINNPSRNLLEPAN